MKKITIETLTPVHIGSGRDLSANTEFLTFTDEDTELAIIDEEKVLNIIGEENIDKWVGIINNNEELLPYLRARKPDISPIDVKKRSAIFYGEEVSNCKTLKEQLHNGQSKAYIPGSSIKGAIRTSVLATMALSDKNLAKRNLKNNKGFSGQELEKKLFGNNPNVDVFRFLQIGDAYFNYDTIAIKAEIFNMHFEKWKFKPRGSHLIEAIPDGADAYFNLKINRKLLNKNNPSTDSGFLTYLKLFSTVNEHTKRLLTEEIDFLTNIHSTEDAFGDYLEKLEDIKNLSINCSENECVLRIGFGSGWRFITGGWAKDSDIMNDMEYSQFLKAVRRKEYNDEVPFPKSRKIGDIGDMFGFVKLKIAE